ncbi:MAG: phosphate ABC transporter permease subunit PstC [Myxococcales bacterium]|nr:phosphate ABC transporter permease subunit PstC [Myxococcales bacterium]
MNRDTTPEISEVRLHGSDSPSEGLLRVIGGAFGLAALGCTVAIAVTLTLLAADGADLASLRSVVWNPAQQSFGVLPFLAGTVVVAVVAMVLAVPVGLLSAVYLAELAGPKVARSGAILLELMAATPAVVVGFWGRSALVPALREGANGVGLAPEGHGFGIAAASLVLAVMTIPTIAIVAREILRALPRELREGPMALGITRWETILKVLLPSARRGLYAATALGFGRALGETIAVSMVIGGRASFPSFGGPAATASSVLVDELLDATHPAHLAALALLALSLLVFGAGTSAAARFIAERRDP